MACLSCQERREKLTEAMATFRKTGDLAAFMDTVKSVMRSVVAASTSDK